MESLRNKLRLLGRSLRMLGKDREAARPILVTGMPRSGTTWAGRTIAESEDVGYIHEPFKPQEHPGIRCSRLDGWFQHICGENAHLFIDGVRRPVRFRYNVLAGLKAIQGPRSLRAFFGDWSNFLLYRLARARPLLKDPIALFSAEWLAENFNMDVVVMVRHPAAFASSIKQLNWPHDFNSFTDQPLLMKHHLHPFEEEIREYAAHPPEDIVDGSILFWKCGYHMILRYRRDHPDWIFVRHEDLARNPLEEFPNIFRELHIDYTDRVARYVREHTGAHNAPAPEGAADQLKRDSRAQTTKWKELLTDEEIERIRAKLADWWRPFYSEAEW